MYMKRMQLVISAIVVSLVSVMPAPALAHVGFGATSGLQSGFIHPFAGVDHLLAMVAIGIWAAQVGGRAKWVIPATFVSVMILAGAIGMFGVEIPFVEVGIVLSVIVLGLLIAGAVKWSLPVGALLVTLFAFFHGHAHGTEIPVGVDAIPYSAGFSIATVILHAVGILLGSMAPRLLTRSAIRVTGGVIAAAGVALAVSGL